MRKEWQIGDGESDWGIIIEGNTKKFWKEVKRVKKREQARDENGQILRDGVEVRMRWAEYFEQVLNVADVREANINIFGIGGHRCWKI